MKALPKGLKIEAIQKRCATPEAAMLMIMVKYQPGTRKEKEALLEQIQNPESCYNQEKALNNLKLWKRRIERAKELKAAIPDPVILLNALDTITYNAVRKDQRRLFRVNAAREALSVDTVTTEEGVQKIALLIEGELEDAITGTWTLVTPKVKSMKGNGKGKDGKDGKEGKGKGKDGKGKDGKGKKEPCHHFAETEDGCKHGQHCWKYHRMLKPEEKRCYVC